jgi:menaquinone-specific isochorismate synthase
VALGVLQVVKSFEKTLKRFQSIENDWNLLLKSAIQLNGSGSSKAVGPLLVGGFSFDPTKRKTSLWEDFPEAQFYLPKYVLTIEDDNTWLTTNVLVSEYDHSDQVFKAISVEEEALFSKVNDVIHVSAPSIIKKHEIQVEEWLKSVETVVSHINEEKLEKVVLARELKIEANEAIEVIFVLSKLLENQSSSYIFAIESGGSTFIGATPERLIKKENDKILSTCLAGSIKRGCSDEEDKQLAESLLDDPKNLAEHKFVVDMITTELSEVCMSITKPSQPTIFKARDIQHLYTPIVGEVRKDVNLLSIVERLHPTPALGGYPQQKALEEIRMYEQLDRGWYAGPIGWLDGAGNGEFAVAIRSGLIRQHEASLFAGCGIVAKSEASKEYEETNIKFKPMLAAIGGKIDG